MLGALGLFAAAPASAVVLVSNTGQTPASNPNFSGQFTTQGFTTGSSSTGYTLQSIEMALTVTGSLTSGERGTIRAELWSDNSGAPNAKLHDLTVPASVTTGNVTFAAPSNTTLSASTTYHMVVYTTGSLTKLGWRNTASDSEDSGGATGWSIANVSRWQQSQNVPGSVTWVSSNNATLIRVNGEVGTATDANLSALSASTHTSSTGTFTALTLTPSTFSATTTSYTASVGNARTHLKITPTVAATGATVKVGKQGTTLATVASGSASAAIALSVGSNAITVEVTASDTTTKKTYTVTVTRQQALAAGQVWAATLTPSLLAVTTQSGCSNLVPAAQCSANTVLTDDDFSIGNSDYTISLIQLTSSLFILGFTTNAINLQNLNNLNFCVGSTALAFSSSSALGSVANRQWSNSGITWTTGTPVSVSIGTSCTTQTMTPTQSTDATLSALSATQATSSSGPFSALSIGAFASATTSYTATVANSITHVKLTPTVNESNATVKVGKQGTTLATVTSGSASGAIALTVGANALNVEVTAQDGTTTQTYTVTVNRAQSTDATLSGLTATSSTSASGAFSALSIGTFASGTTSYSVSVANSITHVKLTPTVNESNATVKVGKGSSLTAVTSGQPSTAIALSVGANAINVEVTAQDGTATQTYTVTVTRLAPPTQSNDAALSALTATRSTSASGSFTTLNIGTFSSGTTSYSASVGNSVTHVKLTPTVNNSNATVKVGKGSSLTTVTSGQPSGAIALTVGANAIKAVVTAQDGTTTQTYTVTVTRASQQTQSTDATLSGLTATSSTSASGSFTTLNIGAFAAGTTSYSASVGNSVTHVKLTPTVNHSNATVKVGKQGTTLATVPSGTASSAIALSVGSNTLVVRVTAEDTTTSRNYTVTVTRQTTATEAESAALNLSLDGLARTLLSGAVGVIGERIAASDEPAPAMPESADADAWMSATGLRLSPAATSPKTDAWRDPHAQNPDWITGDLSWNRSFAFSLDTPNDSQSQTDDSQWRVWGTGDRQNFRRADTSAASRGGWNTVYLGLERRVAGHWLGGLALASGRGKADYSYSEGAAEGRLELRLKAAYPYFSAVTAQGVEIWAMAGAGQGRATNTINAQEPHRGRFRMRMATAGLRMRMAEWPSVQLSALADAGAATLRFSGEQSLANLKSSVRRVRAGLELSGHQGEWSPYMRLSLRHEGGGLSAAGLESEAGARYSHGRLGMDLRMRWMRLKGSGKYRESGAAATLRISPAADGTGLSLTLTPSRGRPDGTDLVWGASPLPSETPAGAGNGLAMTVQVGYGIRPLQLPGLVTPTLGYARGAQGDERLRVSADYTTDLPYELRLGFGLERRETLGGADRNVRLDAQMRW